MSLTFSLFSVFQWVRFSNFMGKYMSDAKPQTKIDPVDKFVRAGFEQHMQSQFRTPVIWTESPDALANLKAMLGNKQPEYPYIFLFESSTSPNTESYTTNRLARHGIPVTVNVDGKQFQTAKLLPTNFEIEVTFISNKYAGLDPDSVNGFVRRWWFTRRNGALNFSIDYGLSRLTVTSTVSDSLAVPKRENPADQESVYQVVANITVHGYISEAALMTRGRINQIVLADAPPLEPGQHFFPFN
jgi:hypothetical protein